MDRCEGHISSKSINSTTQDYSNCIRNTNEPKQSFANGNSIKRKISNAHDNIPTYLRHTETSFRRMSIVQEMNPRIIRKTSNLTDLHFINPSEVCDIEEDEAIVDCTNSDLNEIEAEILRVQLFISARSKYLKLDQLQQELTLLSNSDAFEDSIKEKDTNHKENKRKSAKDSYLDRRRSLAKITYSL